MRKNQPGKKAEESIPGRGNSKYKTRRWEELGILEERKGQCGCTRVSKGAGGEQEIKLTRT